MKKFNLILLAVCLLMASCATPHHDIQPEVIHGFWFGLWNGITSPITFIVSLFSDKVTVWETHNNGGWYTFGFLCGIGLLHGSGSTTKK